MSLQLLGALKVLENLKGEVKKLEGKAKEVLRDQGNQLLRESRNEVPLDTSTLLKSSKSEFVGEFEREVSYNTPYALRVHEHPEYNFQRGRKAKYLEDPHKRLSATFAKDLAEALKF